MQAGLQLTQWLVHQLTGGVAEHAFGSAVGVAQVTVPVDPENAHRAVVDGELTQAQCLGGLLVTIQLATRTQQPSLEQTRLLSLPIQRGCPQHQQQAEK